MPKQYINPDGLFRSVQYGFSQVVTATGTRSIYISGQTGRDAQEKISGEGDLDQQTRQALRNVETALVSAGGTPADVVALRLYIVNYHPAQAEVISAALRDFFPAQSRPCSTWVGVASLASPDFLIEIEATAVVE